MEQNVYESLDARIQRLQTGFEKSQERELSQATRRTVAEAVRGYSFRDGQSQRDFQEYVVSQMKPSEDEALATYDGIPLAEFVKKQYSMRPRLHPEPVSRTTTPPIGMSVDPAKVIDKKQIRPGMTPQEFAEIGKTLAAALERD